MAALLEARNVTALFPVKTGFMAKKAVIRAVSDVSFVLGKGECLGLVGESGCGKSTLGRLASGLLRPSGGQVLLNGENLPLAGSGTPGRIQMIFQDPSSSLDPRMTVLASVAEPLRAKGVPATLAREKARQMLGMAGLPDIGDRYPHQFSGGQKQRIAIARSLVTEPEVIICDEPVSALDASIQGQILNLLCDMQERFSPAYLFISHDLAVIGFMCPKIMVMYLGQAVEVARRDDLFSHAGHPYTRALLAAMPKGAGLRTTLPPPLSGELPSPIDPPSGCYFHPRCPVARPVCSNIAPEWHELGPAWKARCHFAEETARNWIYQASDCPVAPGSESGEKAIVPQVSAIT